MNKLSLKILGLTGLAFALITISVFLFTSHTFSSKNPADLNYFKGNWTVTLRNDPKQTFSWTVKEDLNQSWLNGVVEKDGSRISTDFWRNKGSQIERFAFTGNSVFVRIESSGWEGDKMVLNGVLSDKSGETKIRETITKVNQNKFNALWEMQGADGKWVVFGDEICTKN